MGLVNLHIEKGGIAVLTLNSGKVNPIDAALVKELKSSFAALNKEPAIRAIVLTGREKFFSFGFNIPEFLTCTRESFTDFLIQFTSLYQDIYACPKPTIAAINGHCIASAAILACACDYRIMVAGKTKIGLNELGFGATVLAGAVELLTAITGPKNAGRILYSGDLLSAGEAFSLGLVDKITTSLDLKTEWLGIAESYASKSPAAFASIKRQLHQTTLDRINERESHSIHEFVDVWYSEETQARLATIKVHP